MPVEGRGLHHNGLSEDTYQPNDSNAMVAMGVLYGEGRKGLGQTAEKPGSMGANMEYNAEQDVSFGFAMLVAEWRPDLAQDMAVGFVDRTAEKGVKYDYVVQPTVIDIFLLCL